MPVSKKRKPAAKRKTPAKKKKFTEEQTVAILVDSVRSMADDDLEKISGTMDKMTADMGVYLDIFGAGDISPYEGLANKERAVSRDHMLTVVAHLCQAREAMADAIDTMRAYHTAAAKQATDQLGKPVESVKW